MYAIANTTINILRGTSTDSFGDIIDTPVVVYSNVLAFISSPMMSPLRPIVLGSTVYEPAAPVPSTTRLIACTVPSGTDLRNSDQVLDNFTQVLYEVYEVATLGWQGARPDIIATLKRVTTTESL